jgi:hypothetical protein
MPGYITNVLNKLQHDTPKTPQHTPSRYVTPDYGAKMQYATQDETPPLSYTECTTIKRVTGSVLYDSRAIDPTVSMPLNDIETEQTTATEITKTAAGHLLDYLATHPDATIQFHASAMILHVHSEASYLSVSKASSRLGGLFYLGYNPPNEENLNGSILNIASVIRNVVASSAESEVGACFQNAQTAAPLRVILVELGHKQPETPLRKENSTASGILNETIKQKGQNPWILNITGYKTESAKSNLTFIGAPVRKTLEITIPNTIQRNIIKICALYNSIRITT